MKTLLVILAMAGVVCAEDFTLTDGTVYKGARVKSREADCLVLRIEDGLARVPFTKLSPEVQKKYDYNPEAAAKLAEAKAEKSKKLQEEEAERQLLATAIPAALTVQQITEDGFLATAGKNDESIYVLSRTDGLVDNMSFHASMLPNGTKKFTTVLGATRTVRCYRLVAVAE